MPRSVQERPMLLSPSLLFRAPACFPTLGPLSGLCNHLASHPGTFASLSPLDDWSARTKVPELEMLFGRKICGAGHAAHVQKTLTDNTGVDVRPYTEIITEFPKSVQASGLHPIFCYWSF